MLLVQGSDVNLNLQNGSIGGESFHGACKKTRTFAPDRTCTVEGCDTRLSIYNSTRRCAAHDAVTTRRAPRGSANPNDEPAPGTGSARPPREEIRRCGRHLVSTPRAHLEGREGLGGPLHLKL